MPDGFRLLMISAMYENGGNTTHRLLDGHAQLMVYPFESQLGTSLVTDYLSSMFPLKYRWPTFALDASPEQDYHAIIDEEAKVRAKTPHVSKFRHVAFEMSDGDRATIYKDIVEREGRSRATNVAAFFRATFEAWRNHVRKNSQCMYVGYSPIVAVDSEKILSDFPEGHVLHVVRNPWSAYADTKKRAVPLSLEHYMTAWTLSQYYALLAAQRHPDRFHILRCEDILQDPVATLGAFCERLGLDADPALAGPSWNGTPLEEVYPWGTIRRPTTEANLETARELSPAEREAIAARTQQHLEVFGYSDFLK